MGSDQKRFGLAVPVYHLHLANTTHFFKPCLFTWTATTVSYILGISGVCVVSHRVWMLRQSLWVRMVLETEVQRPVLQTVCALKGEDVSLQPFVLLQTLLFIHPQPTAWNEAIYSCLIFNNKPSLLEQF